MYYLMVNWDGNEGIFCAKDGRSFKKESPHTMEEMSDILGVYTALAIGLYHSKNFRTNMEWR